MSTTEKVVKIYEDILEVDMGDSLDLDVFENGLLDSLGIIELLCAIDDTFGISLQPTDLERSDVATINSLVSFLENRLK